MFKHFYKVCLGDILSLIMHASRMGIKFYFPLVQGVCSYKKHVLNITGIGFNICWLTIFLLQLTRLLRVAFVEKRLCTFILYTVLYIAYLDCFPNYGK